MWIPNNDPGNITNFATSTLQIPSENQTVIFDRSYRLVSRGFVNSTDASLTQSDPQWGTCVACAAVERARARQGYQRAPACEGCFSRYCFTGDQKAYKTDPPRSSVIITSGFQSSTVSRNSEYPSDPADVTKANLAADMETSGRSSAPDLSTLERNSYIAIALLAGTIVLLIAIAVTLVRRRQKGYVSISQ